MSGRPTTVTLSGIVGAGKSTAAKAIVQALRAAGYDAEYVRFQEFIDLRLRSRRAAGAGARWSTASAATPDREDARWAGYKRRRLSWPVTAGYLSRVLLFRWRLRGRSRGTVLVFDRYFYDSLVHYDLDKAGVALKLLLRSIPVPRVAALLLVGRDTILNRRAKYSPEYAEHVARSYEELPGYVPNLLVTRTDDFASVGSITARIVEDLLAGVRQRTS